MNIKHILKNYFTANISFKDPVSYRRVMMINGMMSISTIAFFIFTYLNITLTHDYFIATLDLFTGVMSLLTIWLLRSSKNVRQAAFISTLLLMTFVIVFITRNENSHFGIIWSIFIPYFAILFNGNKVGLYISVFYYSIMFALAYKGIGIWNEGNWELIDFLRFVLSAVLLTLIISITESAHSEADKELQLVRKNEQKNLEKLTRLSITDALTDTYNRRYFNEILPDTLNQAKDDAELVSLFILDIDYFKQYNDTYGHYTGDMALKQIASQLLSLIEHEDDHLFRIGGEEFAGIIHVKSKDQIEEIMDSIHKSIQALNIEHTQSKLSSKTLTVSIGVCTSYPSDKNHVDYFYKKADDALYKAKGEGRNQTVFVQ